MHFLQTYRCGAFHSFTSGETRACDLEDVFLLRQGTLIVLL